MNEQKRGYSKLVHRYDVFGESLCTRKGTVESEGKWWCKQHSPEARKAQQKNWEDDYRRQREQDEAFDVQARLLLQRLGVEGDRGHGESLVISFSEAKSLAERLERQPCTRHGARLLQAGLRHWMGWCISVHPQRNNQGRGQMVVQTAQS